ncbi:hypothetical protein PYW08_010913 [Mythimna loreyi]|uniref:Uncharacterized protein n=1 Tax=Mythimna loreyi TaxID=667449 RepID=A0ACC2Q494_9NEOP|nr:hypothetical protein PYW08_010913 [Mythimna loreyi]
MIFDHSYNLENWIEHDQNKIHYHHHFSRKTVHRIPTTLVRSSFHLVGGLPTLRLPVRGRHSRTFRPQRPSVLRAMCPAHCNLSLAILFAMSATFLLLQISSFLIGSCKEIPSIALSIALWVTLNLPMSKFCSLCLCYYTRSKIKGPF